LENFKKFHILLKNSHKAIIRLRKFSYIRHFANLLKTVKNSLNISGELIILEKLGKRQFSQMELFYLYWSEVGVHCTFAYREALV
jgi:hypothetical protein